MDNGQCLGRLVLHQPAEETTHQRLFPVMAAKAGHDVGALDGPMSVPPGVYKCEAGFACLEIKRVVHGL